MNEEDSKIRKEYWILYSNFFLEDKMSTPIRTITLSSRELELYDWEPEQVKINETYDKDPILTARIFHVPSSRLYYKSYSGDNIPYLALSSKRQFEQDIEYWLNPELRVKYIPKTVPSSSPEVDILNLLNGTPVRNIRYSHEYIEQIMNIITAYMDDGVWPRNYPKFGYNQYSTYTNWIHELVSHPINPSSNFILALNLAQEDGGNEEGDMKDIQLIKIQEYLDNIGVVNFTARDIKNESFSDRVFYLTRFYGPPRFRDVMSEQLEIKQLLRDAKTESAKLLAQKALKNQSMYEFYKLRFTEVYNEYNKSNDSTLWRDLGAHTKNSFFKTPFTYLKLIFRPKNLPKLTYNTLGHISNPDDLQAVLVRYTDMELASLVGEFDPEFTRPQILRYTMDLILHENAFLLTPNEAQVCQNSETGLGEKFDEFQFIYVGIGRPFDGFICYNIEEIVESFNANTSDDGFITFRDPNDYTRNISLREVEMIRDALVRGRFGIPRSQSLIDLFDKFVDQYKIQESGSYKEIIKLREFANNPTNEDLIRDLFISYFEIGMYMRQWQGPGYPYPIKEAETGFNPEQGQTVQTALQVNQNVSWGQERFEQLMSEIPEEIRDSIWDLRMKIQRDQIENYNYTIRGMYDVVNSGEFCIRMASGPWVTTGAYYLKQILGEDIPGFNTSDQIDFIY